MDVEKVSTFTKPSVMITGAVLCTLLWGSAYPCVKIGYRLFFIGSTDVFTQLLFAGLRFTLAGIMTIAIACLFRKSFARPSKDNLLVILLTGFVLTTLEYVFFYIGLAHSTGVKSSILNACSTFIAVLLAHFLYKNDKLNKKKMLGCAIGFLGVVIINMGAGQFLGNFSFLGEGFVILASACFAVGSIISKRAAEKGDSIMVTGYQLTFGGGILLAAGLAGGGSLSDVSVEAVLLLVYLAVLSCVAYTLWTTLLKYNSVGRVTVYNFLTPVFGVLLSGLFLKETILSLQNLVALVFVCVGIYIVNRPEAS